MTRTFLLLCAWSLSVISQAQITLESCKQQARENYPLVRQYDLIQLSEQYTLSNVAKGNLPQISVSGKYLIKVKLLPSLSRFRDWA